MNLYPSVQSVASADRDKKLSYRRETARRAMLVNSCCFTRCES